MFSPLLLLFFKRVFHLKINDLWRILRQQSNKLRNRARKTPQTVGACGAMVGQG
jgi:hypothetical protein